MATQDEQARVGEIYRSREYLERNESWHVEDSAWKAQKILGAMKRCDLRPKSVCEVGCGAGEILRQLSLSLPESRFHGFEVSEHAFEMAKSRESDRVKFFLSDLSSATDPYECLLCIDVFEHIEDYFGFLRSIRSKAEVKIFHIPLDISVSSVLRSKLIDTREKVGHLHYFTRETALATLSDCGYEIQFATYTNPFMDMPAKSLKSSIGKYSRRAFFALSPDASARVLGGSSLLVVAR